MQRERTGLYSETRDTILNGKSVSAEFRVYRVRKTDPADTNPDPKKRKYIELPLWTWDCPFLKLPAQEPHPSKAEAIEAMQNSCAIGFNSLPIQAVALAVVPTAD